MKKEQGKISMRLFKKEKIKPRKKSIIVIDEPIIEKQFINQLEVLFDPVFAYQISQRLSVFFRRWHSVLAIYPIKKAFYHINDIGFIKLYISFGVNNLLDDIEIKHFFQTVQELLTEPYASANSLETIEPVFHSTPEKPAINIETLDQQDLMIESLQDKLLEQDKIVKQWSENQDKEQQALMEQLDLIEKENQLLQNNLERVQQKKTSSLGVDRQNNSINQLTHSNNERQLSHKSDDYRQKFNVLSKELGDANKLISDLEQNNTVLTSTLEKVSNSKNILAEKEQKQSKELKELRENLVSLKQQNKELSETLEQERIEKDSLLEQLQQDTKEFESTIAYQEQQLVMASTTEFKMQATIDELTIEKNEQTASMQEIKLEKEAVQNQLDKVMVEKENISERLEEQKEAYWELEKKLKGWIEKSQLAESSLEEERNRSEANQSSLENDVISLRQLNQKLSEENTYYQNEMRRLLKEVNRLSDRVAYLQKFVDQTLIEEQEEVVEENTKESFDDIETEDKRKKRYDDQGILKLFQKADDAEVADVKVPVEEYREYRLSLKFLEYRWYQANIMQVNATGESELAWSEVYVSESGEFFEELENLVKIPLLSKKYVIMDKEVLLRLKAYQALSDYLERRYFKSSKHFFDGETND